MIEIENALKKFYENRDKSHDWNHVINVKNNALMIIDNLDDELTDLDINIILISCIAHDIWDHKYSKDLDKTNTLKNEFTSILSSFNYTNDTINDIITIIDNISFAKEFKLRNEGSNLFLPESIKYLRNIVSDSDKLEALGIEGIKRMIDYRIYSNNQNIMEDIKEHYNNKLSKLIKDDYIKLEFSKKIGSIKIKEMENIISDDLLLQDFLNNYILNS